MKKIEVVQSICPNSLDVQINTVLENKKLLCLAYCKMILTEKN